MLRLDFLLDVQTYLRVFLSRRAAGLRQVGPGRETRIAPRAADEEALPRGHRVSFYEPLGGCSAPGSLWPGPPSLPQPGLSCGAGGRASGREGQRCESQGLKRCAFQTPHRKPGQAKLTDAPGKPDSASPCPPPAGRSSLRLELTEGAPGAALGAEGPGTVPAASLTVREASGLRQCNARPEGQRPCDRFHPVRSLTPGPP